MAFGAGQVPEGAHWWVEWGGVGWRAAPEADSGGVYKCTLVLLLEMKD